MNSLSPSAAAAEIVALINSRIASPRLDELVAIVAKVALPPEAPATGIQPLHAEIASVAAEVAIEYREAFGIDGDPRIEPLRRRLGELAAQLPCTPTVANVRAWAEIALAYAWEERNGDGTPIAHPFCGECEEQDTACANLIAAARALGSVPIAPPVHASGAPPAISIKTLANEKARICAARDAFDEARVALWSQLKRGDPDGSLARRDTELSEHEHAADARALEFDALMLQFEPQTPTEVLSLALVFGSELDTLLSHATHADPELEPAAQVLERVHDALLRGLVFRMGLQSPILADHVPEGWHDRQQADIAEVNEEARRLLAQPLVTLDDVAAEGAHHV